MVELLREPSLQIVFHFLVLLLILLSLIFSLGVVWQAEKRLDAVYKVFSLALGFLAVRQVLVILTLNGIIDSSSVQVFFELVFVLFMTISLALMNRTLRDVWKEK